MKKLLILILIAQITNANKVNRLQQSEYVWDLSSLFASDDKFQDEIATVNKGMKSIQQYKGKQIKTAIGLLNRLDDISLLRVKVSKMVIYANAKQNVDMSSQLAIQQHYIAIKLQGEVESSVGFIEYLVAKIPHKTIQDWYISTPKLLKHEKRINRIMSQSPYHLSIETEESLKKLNHLWSQSSNTYNSIIESNFLQWPEFDNADGKKIRLTPSKFARVRRSQVEYDRRKSAQVFLNHMGKYRDILAIQLSKRIDAALQIAKIRGFDSAPDAEFFLRDGLPIGTADVLRKSVIENKDTLRRYIHILAKLDGSENFNYADIKKRNDYKSKKYSLKESIEIVQESTSFLGQDYSDKIAEVLNGNAFHLANSENKRHMWAVYPPVGGAKPFTLMSYNQSLLSSNVFMRAIVGNIAQHHYLPDTQDDPPVYGNSMVYIGSLLHYDYLLEKATNDDERLSLLLATANRIWASYFRFAMYANFEYRIEQKLQNNQSLNGDEVSQIYYDLLLEVFGKKMTIPSEFRSEWMTISQPFSTYEHQFWPMAIAASSNILDKIEQNKIAKDFLFGKTQAKSDRSYQILLTAGIDMNKLEAYHSIIKRMNLTLDKIENLAISQKPWD